MLCSRKIFAYAALVPVSKRSSVVMTSTCNVAQHDCLLPSSGLRARIFYPTAADVTAYPEAMLMPSSQGGWTNENAYGLADYLRLPRILVPLLSVFARTSLPWVADAPPVKQPHQLVLFSHGLGGSLGAYGTVCTDIARTGRVVVAIEHADGSSQVAYTGAERTRIPYKRLPRGSSSDDVFEMRNGQLRQRVAELGDVLDDIRKLNKGQVEKQTSLDVDGPTIDLTGIVDETLPIIVAGHSFGACTVLAFTASAAKSRTDVRVSDAVCLDAWLYPLGPQRATITNVGDSRVLFVDMADSGMISSLALRRALPHPSGNGSYSSVKVLDGLHQNSSDYAVRIPRLVAVQLGLTSRNSDPDDLMQRQNRAVVEFLNVKNWPRYIENVERGAEAGVTFSVLPDAVKEKGAPTAVRE